MLPLVQQQTTDVMLLLVKLAAAHAKLPSRPSWQMMGKSSMAVGLETLSVHGASKATSWAVASCSHEITYWTEKVRAEGLAVSHGGSWRICGRSFS